MCVRVCVCVAARVSILMAAARRQQLTLMCQRSRAIRLRHFQIYLAAENLKVSPCGSVCASVCGKSACMSVCACVSKIMPVN